MPNHMCNGGSERSDEGRVESPPPFAEEVLQSISWGVNRSGKATLAIKSAHFGTYLRMDGRGPVVPGAGGGVVNCQPFISLWELFRIIPQSDGCVGIQSVYSGHWLRMDGSEVGENGGGTVNCQSFVGSMEKFHIDPLEDGAVAFRSTQFGTYLRMDAINAATQPITTGGGNVNCSKAIRSWERFYIEAIRPVVALKSANCKLYLRVDCCHSSNKSEGKICGQTYLGAWEKFILVRADDGSVSLKSEAFQSYINVADSSGTLQLSDEQKSKFRIIFTSEGPIALECQDHKPLYLTMSPNGTVCCEPPPLRENHFFTIVVDT